MMANSKMLYRYALLTEPRQSQKGSIQPVYERSGDEVMICMYPQSRRLEKTQNGLVVSGDYQAIVNDCDCFQVGDRIGDSTTQMYEVMSCMTITIPIRQQHLELKDLCRKNQTLTSGKER